MTASLWHAVVQRYGAINSGTLPVTRVFPGVLHLPDASPYDGPQPDEGPDVAASDQSHILGRDRELAETQRFIRSVPSGPGALILEGSAGIGKTTCGKRGLDRRRLP
ncbi:MAG: hypothetical protein ACRDHI_04000, partial [Actinomycetota bacterium]